MISFQKTRKYQGYFTRLDIAINDKWGSTKYELPRKSGTRKTFLE